MAKILVIDDEAAVRELVSDALAIKGLETVTVPSAGQALAIIFQEPFDLILLDIKLAQESGISVLKKIREHSQKIPVVIYSGVINPELEKEARAAGATEVISKSLEVTLLAEQIAKIIKAQGKLAGGLRLKKDKPILIVDDDRAVRQVIGDFLKAKGYKVLEAEDGEKALALVYSETPAAVLLDMRMPGMDGLATLGKILEIKPGLGVVMLTAEQDDEKVKKAMELGAYGYVLKPFDFLYLELVLLSKLVIAEGG